MSTLLPPGERIVRTSYGYGAVADEISSLHRDVTTEDYASEQSDYHEAKARSYVLPVLREKPAVTVLDVGCGIGGMVQTIAQAGYQAFGVDLIGLDRRWRASWTDQPTVSLSLTQCDSRCLFQTARSIFRSASASSSMLAQRTAMRSAGPIGTRCGRLGCVRFFALCLSAAGC